jgi:hypothetical protein
MFLVETWKPNLIHLNLNETSAVKDTVYIQMRKREGNESARKFKHFCNFIGARGSWKSSLNCKSDFKQFFLVPGDFSKP